MLSHSTLVTKIFDTKSNYSSLKTFGCTCFPCIQPYQSHKFQFHYIKCVFLGYSDSFKGYKCMSSTGQIYISRHVVFNEQGFPFKLGFLNTKQLEIPIIVSSHTWFPTLNSSPLSSSKLASHSSNHVYIDHLEVCSKETMIEPSLQ